MTGALVALGAASADARAQSPGPVVVSATMRVDVTAGDGSAEVEIDYVLSGMASNDDLMVELLAFDPATVTDVVYCCWAAGAETIVLWPATGLHRMASVPFPLAVEDGGAPPPLRVSYHVTDAVNVEGARAQGRIPVLSVDLPPVAGGADVFFTSLVLPAEWVMTEGFPTGLRPGDDGALRVTLPVVPSMVSFRARSDGLWRPGVPLLIDILASTLILMVGFLGWRHLRKLSP